MDSKDLRQYVMLSRDKVLRFKFNGNYIHGIVLNVGNVSDPHSRIPQVNENVAGFLKIKDIDIYRKEPRHQDNLEHFTIYSNQIESEIEIVDIESI